jgi:hypothetical protein
LCGEGGMKYEILRFAQDDGVFAGRISFHPTQAKEGLNGAPEVVLG